MTNARTALLTATLPLALLATGCSDDDTPGFPVWDVPVLTTAPVPLSGVTPTSARSGGEVTDSGGSAVTQRGVCWATHPNPTPADSATSDGTGLGQFTSLLSGLPPATVFRLRAYATNQEGTGYGDEIIFTTRSQCTAGPEVVTDIDGNTYRTVVLGRQTWMMDNLKVTRYRNRSPIAGPALDSAQWYDNTSGAYAWYGNDTLNRDEYGGLYNWYAVDNPAGLCPTGWHVPSDAEWTQLTTYLGGTAAAGGKMKEVGTFWGDPNTGATNTSCFTALAGGERGTRGAYGGIGEEGFWWSSTLRGDSVYVDTVAVDRSLAYHTGGIGIAWYDRRVGKSVRCVKD